MKGNKIYDNCTPDYDTCARNESGNIKNHTNIGIKLNESNPLVDTILH